jgi:hypothetical protein
MVAGATPQFRPGDESLAVVLSLALIQYDVIVWWVQIGIREDGSWRSWKMEGCTWRLHRGH